MHCRPLIFALTFAVVALAAEDCVKTCEAAAADKLGCSIDDLDGCFCKDDFVAQAKECAGACDNNKAGVQSYFKDYYSSCTTKSAPNLATKTDAAAKSAAVATTTAATKATSTSSSTDITDCVKDCEQAAADKLGCKVSDLEGCFCKDDFSAYAKDCASDCGDKTGPQAFFKDYYASCTNKSPPNLSTKSSGSLNTATSTAISTVTTTGAAATTTDSDSSAVTSSNIGGLLRAFSGFCIVTLLLSLTY